MKNVVYVGCGLNINNQIFGDDNKFPFLCCLVNIPYVKYFHKSEEHKNVNIHISLSHIFWNYGGGCHLSGFKSKYVEEALSLAKSSELVRSSEKRVAILNHNSEVIVGTSSYVKKLQLQFSLEKDLDHVGKDIKVTDIAVEDNSLIILHESGKMFSSGIEISLPEVKIVQICVGKEHCLALTENGDVFSWGSGMRGQLGNGEIAIVEYPEKVVALEGLEIKSISCGGWHCAVLSASGDIYVWGWNDVGQLGLHSKSLRAEGIKWDDIFGLYDCHCPTFKNQDSTTENTSLRTSSCSKDEEICQTLINPNRSMESVNVQTTPLLLDFWSTETAVKKVCCGERHTVILLENGTAWATGWNLYGQLGIGCNVSKDEPHLLPAHSVENVYAGGWNTILVISEEKKPTSM